MSKLEISIIQKYSFNLTLYHIVFFSTLTALLVFVIGIDRLNTRRLPVLNS